MKSNRFSRILLPLSVAALLSLAAGSAHAQCAITGPAEICGSPVSLCGPDGSEFYVWTFPDGAMEYAQCITATVAGSYELRYIDPVTHDWAPACTHVLSASSAAPVIAGGSTACEGESIELCGPSGSFEYEWTGPAGFASAAACVSAGASGTYALRVRALPDGCWSEPAQRQVSFTVCEPPAPPPPPPPAPDVANCPRPVWWWSRQCPDHDRGEARITPAEMEAISDCVGGHDATLSGGLCQTLLGRPSTLEMRAQRQVATVWANVCAGELGLTSLDGRPVSLDPNAAVSVAGYNGSVSAWLAGAQSELLQQAGSGNRRASREAYKRLIRVAWHINRGLGIGPVCPPPAGDLVAGSSLESGAGVSSLADESDPEPLAAELIDDSDAPLALGAAMPNPFADQMNLAYAVTSPAAAEISIGVYDISGRLVRELVRGAQAPGRYVARWDGRDEAGAPARGGMYFVLGRIDGQRVQTRVTLVR